MGKRLIGLFTIFLLLITLVSCDSGIVGNSYGAEQTRFKFYDDNICEFSGIYDDSWLECIGKYIYDEEAKIGEMEFPKIGQLDFCFSGSTLIIDEVEFPKN
jgi:hypothetical protein